MILISSILFIFIIVIVMMFNVKKSNDAENVGDEKSNGIVDFFKAILLFIPIFVVFYMLCAIASMFFMQIFMREFLNEGSWAYSLIIGLIGGTILTPIIIYKLLKK